MTPAEMGTPSRGARRLVDLNTGRCLATRLQVADTFLRRFAGLMGRSALGDGEGLLLEGCKSVHTCFMRFSIDVAYLDRDMWVVAIRPRVKPWCFVGPIPPGEHTLELPAGTLERLGVLAGHHLDFEESTTP
ncbi:MAG: DUF192 domain-containing protein [Bacillota bacterium]